MSRLYKWVSDSPGLLIGMGITPGKQIWGFYVTEQAHPVKLLEYQPYKTYRFFKHCAEQGISFGMRPLDCKIKAVFFDMDGTLLQPNREILKKEFKTKQDWRNAYARMTFPGVAQTIDVLRQHGIRTAIISADTGLMAKTAAHSIKIDTWCGQYPEDHKRPEMKGEYVERKCTEWGIDLSEAISTGDDVFDTSMTCITQIGISFGGNKTMLEEGRGFNAINMSNDHRFILALAIDECH